MRILVFSQYYYPEPFKIHEICEELVKFGHEVTVITGRPNYPDGDLIKGYPEHEVSHGVEILRTPIALRGHNPISLIKNYLSYPRKAKKAIFSLKKEYDIVFVYQLSPVLMIKPALYYKKLYKKKVYIYCLDLWPESLKALKIKESNLIFKVMLKVSNSIYRKCDFISVTSPGFLKYLETVNKVDPAYIDVIYQHGEELFLNVKKYQKQDKLNIVFAGNIGKVQNFDCLVNAISLIPKDKIKKIKITIIGSGSYLQQFKTLVRDKNLNDIFIFVGRKTTDELVEYYNQASLFLLSLEKGSHFSQTIPTKLQTYMSAGRGIIGSIDGEAAKIIKKANAGKVCSAGDYKQLSKIILDLLEDENSLMNYAENSRNYFIDNFTIEKYIGQIQRRLEDLK